MQKQHTSSQPDSIITFIDLVTSSVAIKQKQKEVSTQKNIQTYDRQGFAVDQTQSKSQTFSHHYSHNQI